MGTPRVTSQKRLNLLFIETSCLGIKTHKACVQILSLALSSYVALGKLLNLSVPVSSSFKQEQLPCQRVA